MFWLLNGLDKVFHSTDFGLLNWHGKNRWDQFSGYLDRLNWPLEMITPLMVLLFIVEIIVALAFLRAIILVASRHKNKYEISHDHLKLPILLSIFVFIGFSVWDVIVGDRAELLEHGTYIGVLGISWAVGALENFIENA